MPETKPLPSDLVLRYHGLMVIWHRETAFWSVGIERHPAHDEILKMDGQIDVILYALCDLSTYPHQSFSLLWKLVPNPPRIPERDRGKVEKIIKMWQEWGHENRYI